MAVILSGFLVPMRVLGLLTGLPGVVVSRVAQLHSFPTVGAMLAAITMVGLRQEARASAERSPGRA